MVKKLIGLIIEGKEVEDLSANETMLCTFVLLVAIGIISLGLWWVSRLVLHKVSYTMAVASKAEFDDHLVNNKFFNALAHLVPLLFMDYFMSVVFFAYPKIEDYSLRVVDFLIIFVVLISILRGLNGVRDLLKTKDSLKDKPIDSYIQISKIIISIFFVILMLSTLSDQTPLFFITSLGAMTAIILLVFKDTILGFVGSIQLAANDMIRIGDWVTMAKYGADGTVVEINLATVKVQNFDKTITTIPTYSFISDSFKNWRGMEESEGRRIKRSVLIQIDSVSFASDELMQALKASTLLTKFIDQREKEILTFNNAKGFSKNELQARRQTNLGLFRAYLEFYLKNHYAINVDMTLIVRQLDPNEFGVPVEIYCFTKHKDWIVYESVIADIFDHIFASVPHFDLAIFERPSGRDLRV